MGTLFEWNPLSDEFSKKADFNGVNGSHPYGGLLEVPSVRSLNVQTCGGYVSPSGKYTWTTTGKYMDTIPTTSGCNIIMSINLTVSKSSDSTLNETACDKYNFNEKILRESGTYYDTIPGVAGCDSLITLNLTVLKSSVATLFETACSEYIFNGKKLKTSGTYFDRIPNVAGCDSVIVLFLTIVQPTSSDLSVTVCNEFRFGNKMISRSGVYKYTLLNSAGCDSVITLHLTINHQSNSTLFVSACDSYTSPSGRHIWTESGLYADTIPNNSGCDSIITIQLQCPHRSESFITVKACDEYISPGGHNRWTTSGQYVDHLQNAAGCDSFITVNLTIQKSTTNTVYQDACNSYTSPSGLYTWTSGGRYTDTIPNACGCDSALTIELTIDHVDTAVIQDRSVLISLDRTANHQWIDCDNGNTPVPNETWLTYTASKNGHYAVIVSNGACVDTSGIFEIMLTGTTDPSESQVILYPNPTDGNFIIDMGKVYPEALITITRSDGQVIRKENMENSREIEMSLDEPAGIYLVKVLFEGRETVFRVVKR